MSWNSIRSSIETHLHITIVIFICVLFFAFTAIFQSKRNFIPDHGNYWTDMSVIIHADNFIECGPYKLKFISTWDQGCQIGMPLPKDTPFTSIHPSFAAIVLALLRKIGLDLPHIRIIMLLFSTTTIFGVYLFIKNWFNNKNLALIVAFSFATLPFFRLLSDNLTTPYDITVKVWMFFLISKYFLSSKENERNLLLYSFFGALIGGLLFSVEIIPSIMVFSVLGSLFISDHKGRFSFQKFLLLPSIVGLAYLLGGGIRIIQLYWVLGSIELLEELIFVRAIYRLSNPLPSTEIQGFSYYIFWLIYRVRRLAPFHVPFTLTGAFLPVLFLVKKLTNNYQSIIRSTKNLYFRAIPIFLSEVTWYIFFRQHSFEHDHTILQISLSLALLSGFCIYYIGQIFGKIKWLKLTQFAALIFLSYQFVFLTEVESLGYNVQTYFDTSFVDRQVELLLPLFREKEIINLAEAPSFPPFYLIQRIENLPNKPILTWRSNEELSQKRYFLLANPFSQVFSFLIDKMGLVGITRHYAIFDPTLPPLFMNFIYTNSMDNSALKIEERWEGNIGLWGFWLGTQPHSICPQEKIDYSNWAGDVKWLVLIPPEFEEQIKKHKIQLELITKNCNNLGKEKSYSMQPLNSEGHGGVYMVTTYQESYSKGTIISLRCSNFFDCSHYRVFIAPVLSINHQP